MKCSIDGCENPLKARGWCAMHYARWWKHGEVGPAHRIDLHVTEHGTMNEYNNFDCRCDLCKEAASVYQRDLQASPCPSCGKPIYGRWRPEQLCRACASALRVIPLTERHGTETGYKKGCRCEQCRKAETDARRRRRHRDPQRANAYDREYKRKRRAALREASEAAWAG